MGTNTTENGRKSADLKAQKRAAALRENLKKRKIQGQGRAMPDATGSEEMGNEENADVENSQ